jgi:hypothetical protein
MARIRTIKPGFFRHAGLFDAEVETGLPLRVAFAGLWTAADREGRFVWNPRELKLDALPHDTVDFSRVLDALMTRGHIVKYTLDGVVYGCIPSWHDHQVINNRESASEIPAPTETSIESATSTREPRVGVAMTTPLMHAQAEGKGREGKGKGKEGASASAARQPPTHPVDKPEGVTDQTWADWLAHRKKKGATVTASVVDGAAEEARKAQMTLEAFLKLWCFRGSQGLMAEWIKPHERGSPNTEDANAEAARILGFKPSETINA